MLKPCEPGQGHLPPAQGLASKHAIKRVYVQGNQVRGVAGYHLLDLVRGLRGGGLPALHETLVDE